MDFFAIGLRQNLCHRVLDKSTLHVGIWCYDYDILYCQPKYPNIRNLPRLTRCIARAGNIDFIMQSELLPSLRHQEYEISLNTRSSRPLFSWSPLPYSWLESSMCKTSHKNTEVLDDIMFTLQLKSMLSLFAN